MSTSTKINAYNIRVVHVDPPHPFEHKQLPGAVQIPLLTHAGKQTAKIETYFNTLKINMA